VSVHPLYVLDLFFFFFSFSSFSSFILPFFPSYFFVVVTRLQQRGDEWHLRLGDDGERELRRSVCMDLASATSMTTSGMKNDTSDE